MPATTHKPTVREWRQAIDATSDAHATPTSDNPSSFQKQVRFARQSAELASRPLTPREAWPLYHLEVHGRECRECIFAVDQLCPKGHQLSEHVQTLIRLHQGELCSTRPSSNYMCVRVEIPYTYTMARRLLFFLGQAADGHASGVDKGPMRRKGHGLRQARSGSILKPPRSNPREYRPAEREYAPRGPRHERKRYYESDDTTIRSSSRASRSHLPFDKIRVDELDSRHTTSGIGLRSLLSALGALVFDSSSRETDEHRRLRGLGRKG